MWIWMQLFYSAANRFTEVVLFKNFVNVVQVIKIALNFNEITERSCQISFHHKTGPQLQIVLSSVTWMKRQSHVKRCLKTLGCKWTQSCGEKNTTSTIHQKKCVKYKIACECDWLMSAYTFELGCQAMQRQISYLRNVVSHGTYQHMSQQRHKKQASS